SPRPSKPSLGSKTWEDAGAFRRVVGCGSAGPCTVNRPSRLRDSLTRFFRYASSFVLRRSIVRAPLPQPSRTQR
ncbi:hypothetical protein K523DRAFT_78740, partial [Schizophyllum commune Tattone D]